MHRNRGNIRAWLMLIAFSLGAISPAARGIWRLCVGCDDVGITLTQTHAALVDSFESCCETERAPGGDQQHERLMSGEQASPCDCVRIPIHNHDAEILARPSELFGSAFALQSPAGAARVLLDLPPCAVGPRGPPDVGWLPATQTLLAQHASLII